MPECLQCKASILPDSQYCEACGHKVGEPAGTKSGSGSLRGEVAFLSGAVDQAKVRLEGWRQKGDTARLNAERELAIRKQDEQEQKQESTKKKRGILETLMQTLVGIVALAAFVYLLLRMPRNSSPALVYRAHQEFLSMLNEFFEDFG
jgi:hypothetical protein